MIHSVLSESNFILSVQIVASLRPMVIQQNYTQVGSTSTRCMSPSLSCPRWEFPGGIPMVVEQLHHRQVKQPDVTPTHGSYCGFCQHILGCTSVHKSNNRKQILVDLHPALQRAIGTPSKGSQQIPQSLCWWKRSVSKELDLKLATYVRKLASRAACNTINTKCILYVYAVN